MSCKILFEDAFEREFDVLPDAVQDELYAQAAWIERLGRRPDDLAWIR